MNKIKISECMNKKWIIFYDDEKATRHYFVKFYSIGRPKFSTTKFCVFDDILEMNDSLQKLEKIKDLYIHTTQPVKLYTGALT